MLKSPILSHQRDSFLETHPSEDGWKVYECGEELAFKLSLRYLLDFFRDRHPESLQRRFAVKAVETDDLLGTPGKCHAADPGTEWDLLKELNGTGWLGSVELVWDGQPLHCYSYEIQKEGGTENVVLIGTKSNTALRKFQHALDEYGKIRAQKGEREIIVANGENIPIPSVSWDDVILPPGFAEDIQANVNGFFQSRERYRDLGIPYRRGFLFAGPPGCGKTLTLKALANTTAFTFITVLNRGGMGGPHLEAHISHAFYLAEKHSPAIVLFEDLDKLAQSKYISLSHFLNILDGLKVMDGVLVIATSNNPGELDPALLHRPSRFDRLWRFSLPACEERRLLLQRKGARYFSEAALDEVAQKSGGFSMAYVQEIIVNALLACAHSGVTPEDKHLLWSLKTLKAQRKSASKSDEDLAERESLGFQAPESRRPGLLHRLLEEDDMEE
jgi:SpoVK/Ycf46/Vps4 family AAA+-type ATPase